MSASSLAADRSAGERALALGREARAAFPALAERVYLAHHCLGPLHESTFGDLEDYRRSLSLRNRAIDEWVERIEEVRALVAGLIGGAPDDLAFDTSATACQASLAAALSPRGERRRVLVTDLDFRSARYLWAAQASRGFAVETVASPDGVAMPTEALLAAIDERVAIVAVSMVSYFNGAMLDLAPIVAKAHAAGAIVVVDAYQALGCVPVDVRALDVDALVGGTHKWLCGGGTGLAFLYVKPALAESLTPAFPGWIGHREASRYRETYTPAPGARRFEQGTPPMEPIYTARGGLRFLQRFGVDNVRAGSLLLADRILEGLAENEIALRTPTSHAQRGAMVCVGAERPAETTAFLRARGIDVDTRPDTGVRVSAHPLNSFDECDRLVAALVEARGALR